MASLHPPLTDYQAATVRLIRGASPRLNRETDARLASLWHEWSHTTACAGWLETGGRRVEEFVAWATTAPVDEPEAP